MIRRLDLGGRFRRRNLGTRLPPIEPPPPELPATRSNPSSKAVPARTEPSEEGSPVVGGTALFGYGFTAIADGQAAPKPAHPLTQVVKDELAMGMPAQALAKAYDLSVEEVEAMRNA